MISLLCVFEVELQAAASDNIRITCSHNVLSVIVPKVEGLGEVEKRRSERLEGVL